MAAKPLATRRWRRRPAPWSQSDAFKCVRGVHYAVTCQKSTPCIGALNRGFYSLIVFFFFSFFSFLSLFCVANSLEKNCMSHLIFTRILFQCGCFQIKSPFHRRITRLCVIRMHANKHATRLWFKSQATSNPLDGFNCVRGGRSEATWQKFMLCIGPQIPGTNEEDGGFQKTRT